MIGILILAQKARLFFEKRQKVFKEKQPSFCPSNMYLLVLSLQM